MRFFRLAAVLLCLLPGLALSQDALPPVSRSVVRQLLGVTGNGVIVHNNGQLIGRSLIPQDGIEIDNPSGIAGNPVVRATPGTVLLGVATGLNLNSTADQPILLAEHNRYIITSIRVSGASGTPSTAAGGIYTAPGKTGYAIVPSSQAYSALTDSSKALPCTLAADADRILTGPVLYLSLTTAQGAAMTADVYVFGHWLP